MDSGRQTDREESYPTFVWSWVSCITFLSLNFRIYKTGMNDKDTILYLVVGHSEILKYSARCLVQGKGSINEDGTGSGVCLKHMSK